MVREAKHRFKLAMSLFARLAISLYTICHNHMMRRACRNQLGPKDMIGLLTKVWRDLSTRRLRSLFTILGIAVGVAGLVAITSTARNVVRAQRELTSSTSQADISYWVSRGPANLIPLLEADSRIAASELRLVYTTKWRPGSSWMDIELVGIQDFQRVRVNQFELAEGRFPETGEILLDESAASSAEIGPGSSIVYRDPSGRERTLSVSGISRSPSHLSSSITSVALGYVPAIFLRRSLNTTGSNQLLIRLQDPTEAQAVARKVTGLLRRYGVPASGATIRNVDEYPGKRELDALLVIMSIFSALGLATERLAGGEYPLGQHCRADQRNRRTQNAWAPPAPMCLPSMFWRLWSMDSSAL